MRLLLDTHIILWGMIETKRLSAAEVLAMQASDNQIFVSVVSLWEIAIKSAKGQLRAPEDFLRAVESNPDFEVLPVLAEHAWRVRSLPLFHGDPFDRLLVAQALCENLVLVSRDPWLTRYEVPIFGR